MATLAETTADVPWGEVLYPFQYNITDLNKPNKMADIPATCNAIKAYSPCDVTAPDSGKAKHAFKN